jgi:hypothetical protein
VPKVSLSDALQLTVYRCLFSSSFAGLETADRVLNLPTPSPLITCLANPHKLQVYAPTILPLPLGLSDTFENNRQALNRQAVKRVEDTVRDLLRSCPEALGRQRPRRWVNREFVDRGRVVMREADGRGGTICRHEDRLYAIVQYDFVAERPDELNASAGEPIIVIAQSNHEW